MPLPLGTATQKPAKGEYVLARKAKRKEVDRAEEREKAKARRRDAVVGGCRWPFCPYCSARLKLRKEVAHIRAKAMGGDHGVRSTSDNLISFCHLIHQGANSMHSGDRRVRFVSQDGTNGPCQFEIKVGNRWKLVARETAVGVLER